MAILLHTSKTMSQTTLPSRKRPRTDDTERRCKACIDLFSSQGLKELHSEDGYAHRTRQEAEASANEGCSLCEFLVEVGKTKFGKDKFEKYKWSAGDRLIFKDRSRSKNQATTLTRLRGEINGSKEVLTLYPFTNDGRAPMRNFYHTSRLMRTRGSSRNAHSATARPKRRSE